jgi:hypothetical protein
VIFEDGTDLYWARSRVLEYLSSAARRLPAGVAPSLGPDATGVGWVYQYVVRGAQKNLAELRTIQDWYVRYGIAKAEGVAEVASVGGFVKQYSVVIDPRRLQALGIPLAKIREALRSSNMDVGGRTVELAEAEFAVRGRGYIKSLSDLAAHDVRLGHAEHGRCERIEPNPVTCSCRTRPPTWQPTNSVACNVPFVARNRTNMLWQNAGRMRRSQYNAPQRAEGTRSTEPVPARARADRHAGRIKPPRGVCRRSSAVAFQFVDRLVAIAARHAPHRPGRQAAIASPHATQKLRRTSPLASAAG